MATPPIERFQKLYQVDGDCWIWTGTTSGTKTKYPCFRVSTNASDSHNYAHRWSYEYHKGPIPEGWEVDHLCRRILCVNPEHLDAVTPQENKVRTRLAVCSKGHDLSIPENVRWDKQGRRRGCRVCANLNSKKHYSYTRKNECTCKNGGCKSCRSVRV